MSKIRGKNTKSELLVFRYLRRRKIYFQKHYKSKFGNIDIALPRKKKAVFIDGNFWHGQNLEKLRLRRTDENDFWVKKLERNVARDNLQMERLENDSWEVLRIWESELIRKKTSQKHLETIADFLLY